MRTFSIALIAAFLGGCAGAETATGEIASPVMSLTYRLAQFPTGFEADDVTGDEHLVFTGVLPSVSVTPAVVAANRLSGAPVGSLPPPAGGFVLPTSVKVISYQGCTSHTSGELAVIDNRGLPPNAHPIAYVYSYSYSASAGFAAQLTASHPLPDLTAAPPSLPNGIGYASGLLVLGGTRIITDAAVGSVWTCDASFSCALALLDADLGPGPASTATGTGRAPGGGERPYTFTLPTPIFPGVFGAAHVAKTDEVCVERAAAPGGLWCIARATLLDTLTPPFAKTKRAVVPPQTGLSDAGHGIAADKFHPTSPWLYWARSYDNTVRRVNVETLEVQTVVTSVQLFDFPTGLDALPPLVAGSPMTTLGVAMGQEEWNAALNTSLGGVDSFVAPTLISGIKLPAL